MTQVTEREFQEFVRKHNAVPDGFRLNGEYCQTKFKVSGREVGRVSVSEAGRIHEVDETYNTRSKR